MKQRVQASTCLPRNLNLILKAAEIIKGFELGRKPAAGSEPTQHKRQSALSPKGVHDGFSIVSSSLCPYPEAGKKKNGVICYSCRRPDSKAWHS